MLISFMISVHEIFASLKSILPTQSRYMVRAFSVYWPGVRVSKYLNIGSESKRLKRSLQFAQIGSLLQGQYGFRAPDVVFSKSCRKCTCSARIAAKPSAISEPRHAGQVSPRNLQSKVVCIPVPRIIYASKDIIVHSTLLTKPKEKSMRPRNDVKLMPASVRA